MKIRYSIASALIFALFFQITASAATKTYNQYPVVQLRVNDKEIVHSVPAINMDGTTLVPIRVVSESLGAKVSWDSATGTASISSPQSEPHPAQDYIVELEDLIEELEVLREEIRIARDIYEVRALNGFMKAIQMEKGKALSQKALDLQSKLFQHGDKLTDPKLSASFLTLMNALTSAIKLYQDSVDLYVRYMEDGQRQYLEFYVTVFASAYQKELEMKKLLKDIARSIK